MTTVITAVTRRSPRQTVRGAFAYFHSLSTAKYEILWGGMRGQGAISRAHNDARSAGVRVEDVIAPGRDINAK